MSYHISPKTGRPNICRATVGICPFGEPEDHFESKVEALSKAEDILNKELGSFNSFTKKIPQTLEEKLGVLPREQLDKMIRRRLRNENTPREVDAMLAKTGDNTPFYVFYNHNQEVTLDYNDYETEKTFSKGACAFVASELNRVTGYPIALFEMKNGNYMGFGHAAVKLPNGDYFDVMGDSNKSSYNAIYPGFSNWAESEISYDELNTLMGSKKPLLTDNIEPLERAVLAKICFDLIDDHKYLFTSENLK